MSDVIEAASVRISTMADGTLRIVADIEPCNAQAAFQLFAAPGTPMALAALKVGHAIPQEKPKGGELAKLAGMWCQETRFMNFLNVVSPGEAGQWIRDTCEIESRAELDHDKVAAERFHALIRLPYSRYLEQK